MVIGRTPQEIEDLFVVADGHGYRADQRAPDVAAGLGIPSQASRIDEHWKRNFPRLAVAADGAVEVLTRVKRLQLRVGLITNGSVNAQTSKLSMLDLAGFFDAVAISEQFPYKKPDPRIFQHMLDELGVDASGAWFVGDHPINDVWAAERVGMRGFLLPGVGWPDDVEPCGTVLSELRDLLSHLH